MLVDGQRVAPSTQTGAVDINNVPTSLLQRLDIVTGGASAAYGSDAVAGVVNFILDRKFTGVKLNVMGGITDRGDDKQYQITGSVGGSFADGRGHAILSFEHQHEDGIDQIDPAKRKWLKYTYLVPNPAFVAGNGQPRQIIANNVYYNNVSQGSVVNSVLVGGTFTAAGASGGTRRNFIAAGQPVPSSAAVRHQFRPGRRGDSVRLWHHRRQLHDRRQSVERGTGGVDDPRDHPHQRLGDAEL